MLFTRELNVPTYRYSEHQARYVRLSEKYAFQACDEKSENTDRVDEIGELRTDDIFNHVADACVYTCRKTR